MSLVILVPSVVLKGASVTAFPGQRFQSMILGFFYSGHSIPVVVLNSFLCTCALSSVSEVKDQYFTCFSKCWSRGFVQWHNNDFVGLFSYTWLVMLLPFLTVTEHFAKSSVKP